VVTEIAVELVLEFIVKVVVEGVLEVVVEAVLEFVAEVVENEEVVDDEVAVENCEVDVVGVTNVIGLEIILLGVVEPEKVVEFEKGTKVVDIELDVRVDDDDVVLKKARGAKDPGRAAASEQQTAIMQNVVPYWKRMAAGRFHDQPCSI
jgi:hypothetical protein